MSNQKTPTTILLTPERKFHSFGYAARDFYHDLDPNEAKQWLYLEKFKMTLHTTGDLTLDTDLTAANGKKIRALEIFAYALQYFKEQALKVRQVAVPGVAVGGGDAPATRGAWRGRVWALHAESRVHPPSSRGGWKRVQPLWKTGRQVLRSENEFSRDPAIPLLGVYPREMK